MTKMSRSSPAPRLRFPEFRESGAWQVKAMDKLYSFLPTNTFSRDKLNYENGVVKNIHYGDIHTQFPTLLDVAKERIPYVNSSESVPEPESQAYCREGDLVFADASEDLNDVGKSIEIVRLNGELLLSGQHTILARRIDDTLVLGFAGLLFRSEWIRAQIRKEAQGTKVYGISVRRLANVDVAYPADEEEQRKIAGCVTSLDNLIVTQTRKVEALKAHKRGLMQHLLPREGETVPRLRFPEFRDAPEWEVKTLGSLVEIRSGNSPSGYLLAASGVHPFVKVEDLNNCTKYQDQARQYSNDTTGLIPRGSLIFPKRGASIELNKLRLSARELLMDTNMMALIPMDDIQAEFLFYSVSHVGLSEIADNSTIPQINNKHIIPFRITVPLPKEQERIADCLSALDAQTSAEADKLHELKNHKAGLMQQLFPVP